MSLDHKALVQSLQAQASALIMILHFGHPVELSWSVIITDLCPEKVFTEVTSNSALFNDRCVYHLFDCLWS